jgi:hypothetical protein
MLILYVFLEHEGRVVVVTIQDARSSSAAIAARSPARRVASGGFPVAHQMDLPIRSRSARAAASRAPQRQDA